MPTINLPPRDTKDILIDTLRDEVNDLRRERDYYRARFVDLEVSDSKEEPEKDYTPIRKYIPFSQTRAELEKKFRKRSNG